jgi:hypothetical protein
MYSTCGCCAFEERFECSSVSRNLRVGICGDCAWNNGIELVSTVENRMLHVDHNVTTVPTTAV